MYVGNIEFWTLVACTVLAALELLLIFFYVKFTPAKVFFKAFLKKMPVAFVKYKTGMSEFKLVESTVANTMKVKDVGFVLQTQNSQTLENQSKVPIYEIFSEQGLTIPHEYAPIIQEIREAGFKIANFDDYTYFIALCNNKEFFEAIKDKLSEDSLKYINKIKKEGIKIPEYKTYNVGDLAHMFPHNTNPVYIDAKITDEVTRLRKKDKQFEKNIMYVGITCLILVLCVVIVFKTIKTPQPEVIVKTVQAGVQMAQANMTSAGVSI